jgi:hypothetical protein
MMSQRQGFVPAPARTPGDADYPVAVHDSLPVLPRVGDVTVGVVDIGLVVDGDNQPHPWFDDHVVFEPCEAYSLPDAPAPLARFDGHADFVTGLILQEAPTARVRVIAAIDRSDINNRRPASKDEDYLVAQAISALAAHEHVQVINLSFSGDMFTEDRDATKISEAISAHPDIAFVAAAGNDGSDHPVWPAAFDGVHAVGALDLRRLVPSGAIPKAWFSNWGSWVNFYDSGVQELSSFLTFDDESSDDFGLRAPQRFRGWARWSGTSFAAARVSGRIARIVAEHGGTGAAAANSLSKASPLIGTSGARWVGGARVC